MGINRIPALQGGPFGVRTFARRYGPAPAVSGSLSLVAASSQNLSAASAVSCNSGGSFSWIFRCKLTANGSYQSLMYLIDPGSPRVEVIIFPDGTINFGINNSFPAAKTMVFDAFTVVLAEYDSGAGTMRLSLDNGTASTGSTSAPAGNGANVYLGSRDFSALPSNGLFDFVGVINRVLTTDERAELCAGRLDYPHLSAGLQSDAIWWMDFSTSAGLLTPAAGSITWTNNNAATWSAVDGF